jgi:Fe-S cluster biogenesis protein NfuA
MTAPPHCPRTPRFADRPSTEGVRPSPQSRCSIHWLLTSFRERVRLPDFRVGDRVRVINRGARDKQLGEIKAVVPNLTNEGQFQAYIVVFETGDGVISEHYLQYELQHSGIVSIDRKGFCATCGLNYSHAPVMTKPGSNADLKRRFPRVRVVICRNNKRPAPRTQAENASCESCNTETRTGQQVQVRLAGHFLD